VTHLLDVNLLLALIWEQSEHHGIAKDWRAGKRIAVCPITELGFLRVSTSPAFNASMADARQTLENFLARENPAFIPADARALSGQTAPNSGKTTDWYLANLASAHGMKLATLDKAVKHPAAEIVS